MPDETCLPESLQSVAPHERRLLELLLAKGEIDLPRLQAILAEKAKKRDLPLARLLLGGLVPGEAFDRVLASALGEFHELVETGDELLAKNPLQAAARYSQALAIKPQDAGASVRRALAFLALGDTSQALADLDRAVELDPRHAPAFHARGVVHAKRQELDLALADLTRAVELCPSEPLYFHVRGTVYHSQGVHLSALLDYDRALELAPTRARAWNDRALAHIARAEFVPAAQALLRALDHSPATSDVARASARLLESLVEQGSLPAATQNEARERLKVHCEPPPLRKRSITVSGVRQRREIHLARVLLPAGLAGCTALLALSLLDKPLAPTTDDSEPRTPTVEVSHPAIPGDAAPSSARPVRAVTVYALQRTLEPNDPLRIRVEGVDGSFPNPSLELVASQDWEMYLKKYYSDKFTDEEIERRVAESRDLLVRYRRLKAKLREKER